MVYRKVLYFHRTLISQVHQAIYLAEAIEIYHVVQMMNNVLCLHVLALFFYSFSYMGNLIVLVGK